ncbi:hypothetical protein VAR608DRAFT_2343 [Variovorax sp. HW608]|uniref:hypothetical protein n=1 Tax=Variovorax sp. HW608 TaxID=1034889 RepID=UPI00081FC058|nr:hypothetical protein [Variovorax sp. HW608]SCK28231.1 hypothetical protein VAR608DRAFT_2343 [Variovorax sp. HW608]
MRLTIYSGSATPLELPVGTSHHPYLGRLPEVGQTIVIPEDANVDDAFKGKAKVRKIIWRYSPEGGALWPEIICKR